MTSYVLIETESGNILEECDGSRFRKGGVPPVLKAEKGLKWLELVEINPKIKDKQIKEGPTIEITDTTYTRTWTNIDKTPDIIKKEVADRLEIETEQAFYYVGTLMKALNDGSFVPNNNLSTEQLKVILKGYL